jgi:hypothetical protein
MLLIRCCLSHIVRGGGRAESGRESRGVCRLVLLRQSCGSRVCQRYRRDENETNVTTISLKKHYFSSILIVILLLGEQG